MAERDFELNRRDLLRYAAQGAALVGTGGLLATGGRRLTRSTATTAMAPCINRVASFAVDVERTQFFDAATGSAIWGYLEHGEGSPQSRLEPAGTRT
jgi:hypothetical protein